nr:hypothetical protein [Tanacetum cinerariifolium]
RLPSLADPATQPFAEEKIPIATTSTRGNLVYANKEVNEFSVEPTSDELNSDESEVGESAMYKSGHCPAIQIIEGNKSRTTSLDKSYSNTVTEKRKSRSAQVKWPSHHLDDHADFGSITCRWPML